MDRYLEIGGIRKIKGSILKNDAERSTIPWGTADFSRLSSKQLDALHWIVSSLLDGEIHGRDIYANLLRRVPYRDLTDAYAAQILDESHHSWLFTRYLQEDMGRPILKPLLMSRYATAQLARYRDPLLATLLASLFVEHTAAELLKELVDKVDEPLINAILRSILRDESRHKALGKQAVDVLLELPKYNRTWRWQMAKVSGKLSKLYLQLYALRYARTFAEFGCDAEGVQARSFAFIDQAIT